MSRFTKNSLIAVITDTNEALKASGSNYFYNYKSRNGYHAVDFHANINGDNVCIRCLDCNETPRDLADTVDNDHYNYLGKVYTK